MCVCAFETLSFLRPGYFPHGEIGWNRFWVFELARAAAAATGYGETHSRPQFAPWNWPHKGKDLPSQSHILDTLELNFLDGNLYQKLLLASSNTGAKRFPKFWPMHLDWKSCSWWFLSFPLWCSYGFENVCHERASPGFQVGAFIASHWFSVHASTLLRLEADKALVEPRPRKVGKSTQLHC